MSERTPGKGGIAGAFSDRGRAAGSRRNTGDEGSGSSPAAPQGRKKKKPSKPGKRKDPAYTQVSALVLKDVKARFSVAHAQASLQEKRAVEFGELVNMLMAHFAVGNVSVEELEESLEELLDE